MKKLQTGFQGDELRSALDRSSAYDAGSMQVMHGGYCAYVRL